MAIISKGKTFINGELVTPAALHSMVDAATISGIVNADIASGAAIADTKLAQITTQGKVLPEAVQGTAVITTDLRLSDARTPVSHTHDASAILSGTLPNARTTATSENAANAIVARDASGNFLAGTINGLTVGKGGGSSAVNIANVAIGLDALKLNTTGNNNTACGVAALQSNSDGYYNTASGANALYSNTTGNSNTAMGFAALSGNVDASGNTAYGNHALRSNRNGYSNTACGDIALLNNTTGHNNTAIGSTALTANTSGYYNTAVGRDALLWNTTGNSNTAVGVYALNASTTFSNVGGFGYQAQVTGSNQIQLGDASTTTYAYGAVANRSDIRDKADVRDTTLGLEFVNALRPVDFKWDMREDYRAKAPKAPEQDATEEEKAAYKVAKDKWLEDVKLANISHDGSKKRTRFHHGLIAQEVKAVLDAKGIDFGGFQDHSVKGGDDVLSIGYGELIAPLIKAVQELSAEVAALKAK